MKWNETLQTAAEAASHIMGEEDAIICLSVEDANSEIDVIVKGDYISLMALLATSFVRDKRFKALAEAALKFVEGYEKETEETEKTTEE